MQVALLECEGANEKHGMLAGGVHALVPLSAGQIFLVGSLVRTKQRQRMWHS